MALVDLDTAALLGSDPFPLESLMKDLLDLSKEKIAMERWEICCEASRDILYVKLAELAQSCPRISTRVTALLLVRADLVCNDFCGWKMLCLESQSQIKSILLHSIKHAENLDLIVHLAAAISDIADYRPLGNPVWPELIGFLYQCLCSSSERLIVASLYVVEYSPEFFRDTLLPDRVHQGDKLHLLYLKLSHFLASDKYAVKVTSLRAVVKFILCLGKEGRDMFQDLASGITQALYVASIRATSQGNAERTCHQLLGLLHGLEPEFFTSNCICWLDVSNCLLSIAETMTLMRRTRHQALSLFVRLAASGIPSHQTVSSICITRILPILFTMMADISHSDDAWFANLSDIDTYDIHGFDFSYAGFLFGEIVSIIGGHPVLCFASADMFKNAVSGDWKVRHAAMIAISKLASQLDPQDEVMEESVDNLVDLALKTMPDPHPRVRWAAACAIKSLRDHHPQYLTPYKDRVTSLMLPLIDSETTPRVKARLEAAQTSFCL